MQDGARRAGPNARRARNSTSILARSVETVIDFSYSRPSARATTRADAIRQTPGQRCIGKKPLIVKSVRLRNFRSALDVVLPCDALTALVGPNGAGKSCFLRALQLFYEPSPRFTVEDCYANDASRDVEIEVAFGELDTEERERFAPYLDNETLTVTRVLSLMSGRPSAKYYGTRLRNPDFQAVRVTTGAREAVAKYNELREADGYGELPPVRSRDAAFEQIRAWETTHPERCAQERDEGQFFGFTGVGQGYLGRHTRLILIPAVRDAAEDAADGKGSPIGEIMDMVVRNALASRKDLAELKTDVEARYGRIVSPDMPELNVLASQLSTTLKTYVPFADVSLQWTRGLDGQPEEDWPASVGQYFACFKDRLETTLREELERTYSTLCSRS